MNIIMKEELIKFETAKLAKEKGFDIETDYFTLGNYNPNNDLMALCYKSEIDFYFLPTQSLLQRWLREKHEIFIDISTGSKDEFGVIFGKNDTPDWIRDDTGEVIFFATYEETLEKGLQKALTLIETK
jgi:hypothetical protein